MGKAGCELRAQWASASAMGLTLQGGRVVFRGGWGGYQEGRPQ